MDPWVRKIPCGRKWQSTLVCLPGTFRGQRSLVGYSPRDCQESDPTEQLSTRPHPPTHRHSIFNRLHLESSLPVPIFSLPRSAGLLFSIMVSAGVCHGSIQVLQLRDAVFCSLHHRRWDKISICPRAYWADFVHWTVVFSARFANCGITFATVK